MNRFKYQAMCNEFPWLQQAIGTQRHDNAQARNLIDLDSVEIKRITVEVLDKKPSDNDYIGSLVGIHEWDEVVFVLDDGTVMRDAVKRGAYWKSNYAHEGNRTSDGEDMLEAIARLDVANTLAYIVWACGGYNAENHYSAGNWRATIYKPAKDFTLAEVITAVEAKALEQVKTEATF